VGHGVRSQLGSKQMYFPFDAGFPELVVSPPDRVK